MRSILLALLALATTSLSKATNPSFGTVYQPANLVEDSLAGCIPLTASICYHNYNIGIHRAISAPRPFLQGACVWKKGTESNHNLASVFGIQIDPENKATGTYDPIQILIKDWPVPPYSPHTKAEVLAATIHCLLLSSRATPRSPLQIQIITENKNDHSWSQSFTKNYIKQSDEDQKPVIPTPVGNSIITTDQFGINYVVFPEKNPKHLTPRAKPVLLPFSADDGRNDFFAVWPGTPSIGNFKPNVLQCFSLPRSHFYHIFTSGPQFPTQFNSLCQKDGYLSLKITETKDSISADLTITEMSPFSLATQIATMAMTTKLHYDKPLKITFVKTKIKEHLLQTPGWTPGGRKSNAATTIIDYDPKTQTFAKGTLPGKMTLVSRANGSLYFSRKAP